MRILDKNIYYLTVAGFIWGLSGFTVEIIPGDALQLQLALRLVFVVASSAVIYLVMPIKINKNYMLAIVLLLIYLVIFNITTIVNNASISNIMRELLLFFSCITIIILSSNINNLKYFIKGVYLSLVLLVFFYFINIDFANLFSLLYRLQTELNPNGIGMMAVMLFSLSMVNFYSNTKRRNQLISLFIVFISIIVIVATRSRTALGMMVISFILINILYKNKKTLFISLIIIFIVILSNLQAFENVIRLTTPGDYTGKKNIANLTGRTDLWKQGFEIISNNFFFGVGADKAIVKVGYHMGSFHNAYIQLFVTVGILGFVPLVALLLLALKRVLLLKEDVLITIVFIIGLIGSLVESRLLNFGSPGNFLFLISLIYLSRTSSKDEKAQILF